MEMIYVLYVLETEHISGTFIGLEFKGFTTDEAVAKAWANTPSDESDFTNKQYTFEEVKRIA